MPVNHVTHGLSNTRLHKIWDCMKYRCSSEKATRHASYYDKGITICDEWKNDFKAFYDWSINHGYEENLSIDRIDNNKGYSPDNCRWVTYLVQANNTSKNIKIECFGRIQTISEWARETGIEYSALYYRIITAKWNIEKALTTPSKARRM